MICLGCKYYDDSVDCCNADENCYRVGYLKGREDGIEKYKNLIFQYIFRAGACDTDDIERLSEVARKEQTE